MAQYIWIYIGCPIIGETISISFHIYRMMQTSTIDDVVEDYRKRPLPQAVPRELDIKLPKVRKCFTVIGPRRAGKTYFLFQQMRAFDAEGQGDRALYVNLDDDRLHPPLPSDLDAILRKFKELCPPEPGRPAYLLLDEIPVVKGWERFIRRVIDTEDVWIYLAGSSSRLLSTEVASSMRGRSLTYTLLPFSFREVLRARGVSVEGRPTSRERAALQRHLRDYLRFGGFPEVVLAPDDADRLKALGDFMDAILMRDVVERNRIKNMLAVRALASHLLTSFGTEFSANKFRNFLASKGVSTGKSTITTFSRHLEDAFAFLFVRRFGYKPRELMWSLPKVYPIDTGLATQASGRPSQDLGRLMECVVAVELLRRRDRNPLLEFYYWKDLHGKEVDFVVREGTSVVELIQSCYDVEGYGTKDGELGPLLKASRETGCKRLRVLTWDQEGEERVEGRKIIYEPLWRWLMEGDGARQPQSRRPRARH